MYEKLHYHIIYIVGSFVSINNFRTEQNNFYFKRVYST